MIGLKRLSAIKCHSRTCDKAPTVVVYWPGQTCEMCAECAARALNVAQAMGFVLTVSALPVREEGRGNGIPDASSD